MTAFRIAEYSWRGGREAMLRFGPETGPTVIAALPLFEEANRTRAAVIDVLRKLSARGIGGALPDLPGTGESVIETRDATLGNWREAFAAAAATLTGPVHVMAWRGAALIDGEARAVSRWRLAPIDGAALVRELARVRDLGKSDDYAGNLLSADMISGLRDTSSDAPGARTLRLTSDPRPADAYIPGTPLWRASEPGTDAALQDMIAQDIARWIASCGD